MELGRSRTAPGRIVDKSGYILIRMPDHPFANSTGYVREHRLAMEEVLGRHLRPEEVVHHINRVKNDNRPDNLRLYETNSAHKREDMLGNSWSRGDIGNPKRSYRVFRSPEQMLREIGEFALQQDRPVRRADLVPPLPSYRAVARAFGSWQEGVRRAMEAHQGIQQPLPFVDGLERRAA